MRTKTNKRSKVFQNMFWNLNIVKCIKIENLYENLGIVITSRLFATLSCSGHIRKKNDSQGLKGFAIFNSLIPYFLLSLWINLSFTVQSNDTSGWAEGYINAINLFLLNNCYNDLCSFVYLC